MDDSGYKSSQEDLLSLFDAIPFGMAIYTAVDEGEDFILVDINPAGEAFSSISREEVVGRLVTEAFPGIRAMGLLEVFRRVFRTGETEVYPIAHYHDQLGDRWFENHVFRLPSNHLVAVYENATAQVLAQEALKKSEARFRDMAELLPEAIFETDASLRITYANQKAFDLFGYTPAELEAGLEAMTMLVPRDRPRALATFKERANVTDPGSAEYTGVRRDGTTFPILFHAATLYDEGQVTGIRGVLVDLTESRRAKTELLESAARFQNIVESSPMGMHLYEIQDGDRLVFVASNPAADQILGVDNKIFVGKDIEEAFPAMAETEIPQRYRDAARKGIEWRTEQVSYDEGGISGVFDVVAFQTSPGSMVAMFRDITDQQKTREAIKKSEERLRLATRSGQIGVWEYEIATDNLDWDDLMFELHGVDPTNARGGIDQWRDCVHPEDRERAEDAFRRSLQPGGPPFDIQFRIVRQNDGQVRHIRGLAGVRRNPEGEPLKAIGTNWDITKTTNAEAALRVSEERFRSVVDQSNDALYILHRNRFDLVNPRFCQLTGVSPDEASSPDFDFWQLVAEESKPLIRERQQKRESGEHVPDLYEFQIQPKTGPKVHVEASVTEIEYAGGKAILGILRDITEQKVLESQLSQAQKMESIGRLSGGVAHDLNNLLTPIIGYAELLRDDLSPEDKRRGSAHEIIQAGFRAKDLVRQLLAFSRRQTLEFTPTNLNGLILGFERLLRRTIREDIQIRVNPRAVRSTIRADKGQIEQVLMNLAVNAQDAMPHGGILDIGTDEAFFDEGFAESRPGVEPGDYVLLAFTDTGEGMDEQTRDRVFEPFFTTKKPGHGTGLGLATVYGIIKQHGGNVWAYSELGRGTTFKCYLPLADEPIPEEEPPSVSPSEAPGGEETIVIVEDEDAVRNLAGSILKRAGYSVTTSKDAESCLEILKGEVKQLDLLLTDVVLPGLNGRQLYDKVSEIFPESRVLFMSGYTDEVVFRMGAAAEDLPFLQKPFSVQALARKVREVLDQG